jgi:chloramphenicol O-acetyltransferase type B
MFRRTRRGAPAVAHPEPAPPIEPPAPPAPPPPDRRYTGWDEPSLITMGRHSYGDPAAIRYEGPVCAVTIGAYCSIATGVRFLINGGHRIDFLTSSPMGSLGLPNPEGHSATKGDINVGSDVWIGRDVTVLSGVTIGDGAVVGACAVVASDVAPYSIVVGNPARPIRSRFPAETVEKLLGLRWWEWPDEQVVEAAPLLRSDDVDGLVEFAARHVDA